MAKINTVKPEEQLYVRIFPCSIPPSGFVAYNLNRVAKVTALPDTKDGELGHGMVFIELDDIPKVIDNRDVEFITEKEYFQGVLKYG